MPAPEPVIGSAAYRGRRRACLHDRKCRVISALSCCTSRTARADGGHLLAAYYVLGAIFTSYCVSTGQVGSTPPKRSRCSADCRLVAGGSWRKGLQVVGQEPEPLVRREGAYRAEVAPVECEHRVGPVPGCQSHVDRVGQIQIETGVLLLDQA
jgi:hypothetical protein